VTLLLPKPVDATRATTTTRAVSLAEKPDWSVTLTAEQNGNRQQLRFGVAPGASKQLDARWDTELPPDITDRFAVGFAAPEGTKTAGGRLIGDFRDATATRNGTWEVRLVSPVAGQVTLRWDGARRLPRGTRLVLADPTTGRKTYLAQQSGIRLSVAANQVRRLQITAEPERTTPLAVATLQTTPTRGGRGYMVSYTLTTEAEVTAAVTTLSGKPVRTLRAGRAQAGQANTLTWEGRNDGGNALPTGPYTLVLTARAADGTTVRATRPVVLVR
jgi:hypothetical protein